MLTCRRVVRAASDTVLPVTLAASPMTALFSAGSVKSMSLLVRPSAPKPLPSACALLSMSARPSARTLTCRPTSTTALPSMRAWLSVVMLVSLSAVAMPTAPPARADDEASDFRSFNAVTRRSPAANSCVPLPM